jgi:hypothetical protein
LVLETTAFGEDGAEDAAQAGGVEETGMALGVVLGVVLRVVLDVVLDDGVEDGGFAGFIRDREVVLALEAGDFGDGLGAAVDEVEKLEIELVDDGALLRE